MRLDQQNETETLQQLRLGNHRAFEVLFHRYKARLAANLLRILKSQELAEEILQELFLRIWQHRDRIDPEQSFSAYLYRIADNLVRDLFRKAALDHRMRLHMAKALDETYSHIEELIFDEENKGILHEAIERLPPQRQQVFRLCKLEEKSYAEAGAELNISPGTVHDHVKKANAFLRDYFMRRPTITFVLFAPALTALL